ncbi:MAG: UbiA family prenyltransferase [Promethearchaeota archaeon]
MIKNTLQLLRLRQYYKNVLIFVGIFFSKRLFDFSTYIPLIIGFIILCSTSSINYIINDIIDVEQDKKHSEKIKKKPLASGALSIKFVLILIVILSFIYLIPRWDFAFMVILIIITGQSYNNYFKNHAFIDVIILSTGYLWRALSGCIIIEEYISAWLFLVIFEIAMFLSLAKRRGDLQFLGKENAMEHKKVYNQYSEELLNQFNIIIGSSLFITYSLYLILKFNLFEPESVKPYEYIAIFTIPIFFYIIMRYMYLTNSKPEIARNPEKVIFDKGMIFAGILFLIILFITFYFDWIVNLLSFF